ncbi:hypothetical protein [Cohnella nanjingensis]|uniref:Uncharacterized protein n=1 Tax=Cohnella nanjingensis TaxID=1387779 RepID=A0A7X0RXA8_9BACL|nr:hypothetical protein [Cohnella nanjingensis]MBB6675372.1 hypothetical protein [Cohnella nanjingensis]
MKLNIKNMGFADKMIFILGLTLSGVIVFVLVVGVIVALIKLFMDGKMHSVEIHSVPLLDDEPEAELIAAPYEQKHPDPAGKDDARPDRAAKVGAARS